MHFRSFLLAKVFDISKIDATVLNFVISLNFYLNQLYCISNTVQILWGFLGSQGSRTSLQSLRSLSWHTLLIHKTKETGFSSLLRGERGPPPCLWNTDIMLWGWKKRECVKTQHRTVQTWPNQPPVLEPVPKINK